MCIWKDRERDAWNPVPHACEPGDKLRRATILQGDAVAVFVESVRNKYAEDVSIEHVDEFLGSFDVLQNPRTEAERRIVHPMRLGAVGPASAWLLVMEFFGWRAFRNRREVAALAGLVGTPYNSGDSARNQGISKAGNRRVRAMIVEIAWLWLRFQPRSALSQWYQTRFAGGGLRMRRIGIVALARKLLIALWRYLEDGVMPEGARLIASEI